MGWILCRKQGKLFIALRRAELDRPAVADTVNLRQPTHFFLRGTCIRLREVGAAGVQPLVVRNELRPVPREALEEVLAGPRAQIQQIRPDPAGARLARRG